MCFIEKVFYDILAREHTIVGYIKKNSKSRTVENFPKGFVHGFDQKLAFLPSFILGNKGEENVFYYILERKNAFLGYKNTKFKKSNN